MSAAEAVLGRGRKRQPDWFLEAENSLRPAKRAAHDRLLHADNTSNEESSGNTREWWLEQWLRPKRDG